MSFIGLLGAFGLGVPVGGVGGIVLGFAWYEHKCGLLTDASGKRAMAIRSELDDVMGRIAYDAGWKSVVSPNKAFTERWRENRFEVEKCAERHSDMAPYRDMAP
jgi:hypothetical protein